MYFFFRLQALAFLLTVSTQAGGSPTRASAEYIAGLIRESVSSHPSIEAAKARTDAATSAIRAVRLWEDPQLGLGGMAAEKSMRMDDGDIRVGVDQMLPRKGLFRAEKRRATAEQQVQDSTRQQSEAELGLTVGQTVVELALADELIRLQSENLEWLKTMVEIAAERSKSPDGSASESLRLESELALRTQALASLKRTRGQYASTLNLLLNRPVDSSFGALSLDSRPSRLTDAIALREQLERNNPQLAAMRHQVESAEAEADISREKRKPVFSVGMETNTYSGGDFRSAMLAVRVTLPWFNRAVYRADLARAEDLRDATIHDLAAQQRELYSQLITLITEAQNNQATFESYADEVLPKTDKAVESIQSAWISAKSTLLDVLDARRTLIEAKQEQKRALASRHVADQALIALTGGQRSNSNK